MRRNWILAGMLIILLLAAALRFHRLGAQSLWYDEGISYARALRSLPELLPQLRQTVHVPVYFVLLGWWQALTGTSEFALRSFSVLCSLLSIAWVYALGKGILHPLVGAVAALLVALNNFSIYYAQEVRMYALLAAIAAASMCLACNFRGESRYLRRDSIALALLNAAGIYTQITYIWVIAAQVIVCMLWRWREPKALRSFAAAQSAALLSFLPWLPTLLALLAAQPNLASAQSLPETLPLLAGTLSIGSAYTASLVWQLPTLLLMLACLWALRSARQGALPLLWLLLTLLAYLALELTTRYLRFLLPVQLALALCLGLGCWQLMQGNPKGRAAWRLWLGRILALCCLGAVLATQWQQLPRIYHDSAFQRDDVRGLMGRIEAGMQANDAILVSAPGLQELISYYKTTTVPIVPLPASTTEQTQSQLRDLLARSARIHAIFYGAAEQDPDLLVENTLNRQAFESSDEWQDDLRYVRYYSPVPLAPSRVLEVPFGAQIQLQQAALNALSLQAGDVLLLQLTWSSSPRPRQRYKIFLHLLNPDGQLVAQRDSEPAGGSAPTTSWQPGTAIIDRHALQLPPDLPPGQYRLVLGIYELADPLARLPVQNDTALEIAQITLH